MANLTVTIDAELLKRARMRALEQGTSVNRLVADYLEDFAGTDRARRATKELLLLSRSSTSGSGSGGRNWTRDELYEG
ncbi:MAG: DUF6364 family protein [Actinomycetota bacterium]|nr:DUF6364 family protein [Actinomycetota bacterium]MDQ3733059.1 DUF6364 family protein [Actinomycetota bacterium]